MPLEARLILCATWVDDLSLMMHEIIQHVSSPPSFKTSNHTCTHLPPSYYTKSLLTNRVKLFERRGYSLLHIVIHPPYCFYKAKVTMVYEMQLMIYNYCVICCYNDHIENNKATRNNSSSSTNMTAHRWISKAFTKFTSSLRKTFPPPPPPKAMLLKHI